MWVTNGSAVMMKMFALVLTAMLLAGCFPMASPPQQPQRQTTVTTTTTCPPGTQLGSDGMCR